MDSPKSNRLPDWEPRLIAYLMTLNTREFVPGTHDCALFFAAGVAAMSGIDHARDWRGAYRTLKGGLRSLKATGFDDHVALVASILDEVPPALAWRGDGAVVDDGDFGMAALGFVQGEGIYVLRPVGYGIVPRSAMIRAFRV